MRRMKKIFLKNGLLKGTLDAQGVIGNRSLSSKAFVVCDGQYEPSEGKIGRCEPSGAASFIASNAHMSRRLSGNGGRISRAARGPLPDPALHAGLKEKERWGWGRKLPIIKGRNRIILSNVLGKKRHRSRKEGNGKGRLGRRALLARPQKRNSQNNG